MWKRIILTLFILLLLTLDGLLIADIITGTRTLASNIAAVAITIPLILYYISFYKD
ncbi:MAG: hypothetical protein ACLFNO_03850 [Parcubacteria group bacterium]